MNYIKIIKHKYQILSENNRIIVANIIGAFCIKGLSLFISFMTIPSYISFFDNEIILGLWFTMLSIITWILNFDLGIGNGLRNLLAISYAEEQYQESKKLISSAYAIVCLICLIIIIIIVLFLDYVDWNVFFRIKKNFVSEKALSLAVKIVSLGIVLQILFKIISSVLYAIQKSSVNNVLSFATATLILITIFFVPSGDNDYNLVLMAIVYDISVILPYIIASIIVFCSKKYNPIAPSISLITKKHMKKVLTLGGYFFFVQVLYMLIMSTNEYLISCMTNSRDVVDYRIYFQLFTLGSTIFALALTPIWSAITKAIAERNVEWINQLYNKLIKGAFLGTMAEFFIIPFLQIAFDLWLGESTMRVNYLYAITFATFGALMIFNAVLSNFANGIGKLRTQLVIFLSGAILKVPIAIWLVNMTGSWIGVVWATNIVLFVYFIVQPIMIRKYLRYIESMA